MTLHKKLEGIPHIYYINLEDRKDRREFMENQFNQWGIEKFSRVNASELLKDDIKTWKDLVHFSYIIPADRRKSVCVSLSHLETIRKWLEETSE